jgi:hypothetical protein
MCPSKWRPEVALKVAHSGTHFAARGRVVDCVGGQPNCGIGIEFTEIDPIDQIRLEALSRSGGGRQIAGECVKSVVCPCPSQLLNNL